MSDASEIKTLHRQAMEQTDLALAADLRGDAARRAELFRRAFDLESKAATLANGMPEPTRSVLLRSAASLALDCALLHEAEKLICTALIGVPPAEIADELRDLLEQVYFKRHLALRGVTLHGNEIQMSIAGASVGYGIAPTEAFLDRVQKTEKLLQRTAERQQQKPYRDRGRRDKSVREGFELFMTAPRAGSFAVTFRVGGVDQLNLFGTSNPEAVIDDLVECLEMFTRGEEARLRDHIKEEAYFRNFVGLAEGIAPDGREVSVVGFTTLRHGEVKEVALKAKTENYLPSNGRPEPLLMLDPSELVQVAGTLRHADSLSKGKDEIVLVGVDGAHHKIVVPPGMMSDIVKPLWEMDVVVTGVRKGKKINLQTIHRVDEDD